MGSMPGEESLRKRQYYAHPQNAFWYIMGSIIGFDHTLAYTHRVSCLKRAGVALWDVLKHCERQGSLDSAIQQSSEAANSISELLHERPGIRTVFLNGQKAAASFRRHVLPCLEADLRINTVTLPSSSPANAGLRPKQKLQLWREAFNPDFAETPVKQVKQEL